MKRWFYVLIVIFLVIGTTACSSNPNNDRVLDFRSMRDIELDVIISLGDSRSQLEDSLGSPIYEILNGFTTVGRGTVLTFNNGMEIVLVNDVVSVITVEDELHSGRFEIFNYTISMMPEQIAVNFHKRVTLVESYIFTAYFDPYGNRLDIVGARADALRNYNAVIRNQIIRTDSPHDRGVLLNVTFTSYGIYRFT